jgi:hypothetical protein
MAWTNEELATAFQAATAIIALVALFRPDIGRFVQRRRAIIDVHPAGRLEVGFGNFGPTVGVQGTLQAIHRDAFITYSRVTVVRVADNSRHDFQWAVFRPQTFGGGMQQAEIASGFLLSVAAPRRFNIQFHDTGTLDNFRQSLTDLQKLWTEHLQAQGIVLANVPAGEISEAYNTFHNQKLADITPIYQVIDRQFYWTPGQYQMSLEIRSVRLVRSIIQNFSFILSDADSISLRLNVVAAMRAVCSLPNVIFNFAFPAYLVA